MITVYHTLNCKKFTCISIRVTALPWYPSTGNSRDPTTLGNDIQYFLGSPMVGGGGILLFSKASDVMVLVIIF